MPEHKLLYLLTIFTSHLILFLPLATPGILAHLVFLTSGALAEFSGHCHPGLPWHSMETQVPGHAREGQGRPVPCTFPDEDCMARLWLSKREIVLYVVNVLFSETHSTDFYQL